MSTTVHAVVGVTISVGNAAVQTAEDVAVLLEDLAEDLRNRGSLASVEQRSIYTVDYNGNKVGILQVTGYSEDRDDNDDEED